jgi:hypothetical protein
VTILDATSTVCRADPSFSVPTISTATADARRSMALAPFVWISRGVIPKVRGVSVHHATADGDGGSFVSWKWDGRRLVVESDPFGLVPAFVYRTDRDVAVSTSISKLVDEGATPHIDEAAMAVFLRLGFFVGDDTPFVEIRSVPAGARLVWQDGQLDVSGGPYIVERTHMSRDDAIDCAIHLTARAVDRRRPRSPYAVPLSGGRDSRHILLALRAVGDLPEFVITVPRFPPVPPEDQRIASLLAAAIGVRHVIVKPASAAADEARKNVTTSYCADEHAWFYPMLDYLRGRVPLVYEGIGGSLWTIGWAAQRDVRNLWRSGRTHDVAARMLDAYNVVGNDFLAGLLHGRPGWGRPAAVQRLAQELEKHVDAPDPGKSFHFWNRLRRELSLVPFGQMRQFTNVHTPLVDRELTGFLLSLEPELISPALSRSDKSFHSEAIQRAYSAAASIPFETDAAPFIDARAHTRAFTVTVARHLFARRKPLRLMRPAYVWPRLAYTLVNRRYAESSRWLAATALYLSQLEEVAA